MPWSATFQRLQVFDSIKGVYGPFNGEASTSSVHALLLRESIRADALQYVAGIIVLLAAGVEQISFSSV